MIPVEEKFNSILYNPTRLNQVLFGSDQIIDTKERGRKYSLLKATKNFVMSLIYRIIALYETNRWITPHFVKQTLENRLKVIPPFSTDNDFCIALTGIKNAWRILQKGIEKKEEREIFDKTFSSIEREFAAFEGILKCQPSELPDYLKSLDLDLWKFVSNDQLKQLDLSSFNEEQIEQILSRPLPRFDLLKEEQIQVILSKLSTVHLRQISNEQLKTLNIGELKTKVLMDILSPPSKFSLSECSANQIQSILQKIKTLPYTFPSRLSEVSDKVLSELDLSSLAEASLYHLLHLGKEKKRISLLSVKQLQYILNNFSLLLRPYSSQISDDQLKKLKFSLLDKQVSKTLLGIRVNCFKTRYNNRLNLLSVQQFQSILSSEQFQSIEWSLEDLKTVDQWQLQTISNEQLEWLLPRLSRAQLKFILSTDSKKWLESLSVDQLQLILPKLCGKDLEKIPQVFLHRLNLSALSLGDQLEKLFHYNYSKFSDFLHRFHSLTSNQIQTILPKIVKSNFLRDISLEQLEGLDLSPSYFDETSLDLLTGNLSLSCGRDANAVEKRMHRLSIKNFPAIVSKCSPDLLGIISDRQFATLDIKNLETKSLNAIFGNNTLYEHLFYKRFNQISDDVFLAIQPRLSPDCFKYISDHQVTLFNYEGAGANYITAVFYHKERLSRLNLKQFEQVVYKLQRYPNTIDEDFVTDQQLCTINFNRMTSDQIKALFDLSRINCMEETPEETPIYREQKRRFALLPLRSVERMLPKLNDANIRLISSDQLKALDVSVLTREQLRYLFPPSGEDDIKRSFAHLSRDQVRSLLLKMGSNHLRYVIHEQQLNALQDLILTPEEQEVIDDIKAQNLADRVE